MSLELEIKSLTDAVVALTLAMSAKVLVAEAVPVVAVQVVIPDPVVAVPVVIPEILTLVQKEDVKKSKPAPAVTYEDVKQRILAVSAKSREKAVELLAGFNAASGPKLQEDDYAEFVRRADLLLVELA